MTTHIKSTVFFSTSILILLLINPLPAHAGIVDGLIRQVIRKSGQSAKIVSRGLSTCGDDIERELAEYLLRNTNVSRKEINSLISSARSGNKDAQNKIKKLIRQAEKNGNPKEQRHPDFSDLYDLFKGESEINSNERDYRLVEAAALNGDPEAQYWLALLYDQGLGTAADNQKSIYWILKSASQGFAPAMTLAGACYVEGVPGILEKDPEKGFELIIAAAGAGDCDALCLVGANLLHGAENQEEYETALQILQAASESGSAGALDILSQLPNNQ
jgi:TPR repeat protein